MVLMFELTDFSDFRRFSWDKVLLRSDFFEATPIHILWVVGKGGPSGPKSDLADP